MEAYNNDDDNDSNGDVWDAHEKIINESIKIDDNMVLKDNNINRIGNNNP